MRLRRVPTSEPGRRFSLPTGGGVESAGRSGGGVEGGFSSTGVASSTSWLSGCCSSSGSIEGTEE